MIKIVFFIILVSFHLALAETYKYVNGMTIEAKTFKIASRECFKILTRGVYPGEEKGLDYIDICANPIKGKTN